MGILGNLLGAALSKGGGILGGLAGSEFGPVGTFLGENFGEQGGGLLGKYAKKIPFKEGGIVRQALAGRPYTGGRVNGVIRGRGIPPIPFCKGGIVCGSCKLKKKKKRHSKRKM